MRRLFSVLMLLLMVPLTVTTAAGAQYRDSDVVGTVETLQKATNDRGNLIKEMELCDSTADAVRERCSADIAILNGGDFVANLEGGEAVWSDLQALFTEDRELAVAEITGGQLKELLEYGVSHAATSLADETLDVERSAFEGFPQISGFTFTYDPTAPVGERIFYLELADGTKVTEDMSLNLAATGYMLDGGYGYEPVSSQSAGLTLAEALAGYMDGGTLQTPKIGRIDCIGVSDYFSFPRPMIFLISVAAILIAYSVNRFTSTFKKNRTVTQDII